MAFSDRQENGLPLSGGTVSGPVAADTYTADAAVAVATNVDDTVTLDNNGIRGGVRTTDVAPQGLMVRPQQAFPGGTQTAANLVLAGGQDETIITIVDYSTLGIGESVIITTVDSNGTSTAGATHTFTVRAAAAANEFVAETSHAVTATNLAACINTAAIGVTAVAVSAVVHLTLDPNIASVTMTETLTGGTVSTGTAGLVVADSLGLTLSRGGLAANTVELKSIGFAGQAAVVTTAGGSTYGSLWLDTAALAPSGTSASLQCTRLNGFIYGTGGTFILTAGTMTGATSGFVRTMWTKFVWTNAMVTALGAATTGNVAVCTLPARTIVKRCLVVISTAAGGVTTLTVSVGRTAAAYIDFLTAQDAKTATTTAPYGVTQAQIGADLKGTAGVGLMDALPSYSGTTVVNAQFISTVENLSATTTSTGIVFLETELLP